MNTASMNANFGSAALGLLTGVFVLAYYAHLNLPLLKNDRAALLVLIVIGMAFCTSGMGIDKYGWQNPITIIGSIIGVLMVIVAVAALLGISLPLVASHREAFNALVILGVVKVLLAMVRAVLY